jgi:hypothetical protein
VNAEIFPRDKRSISRREAELVWRRLLELSANTVMKEDITNAIQNHSAIVQRTDIGCFEKTTFIANLVTTILTTKLSTDEGGEKPSYNTINHIFLVVIR